MSMNISYKFDEATGKYANIVPYIQVASGSAPTPSTFPATLISISIAPGVRIKVTRVYVTNEGTANSALFTLTASNTVLYYYLAAPGDTTKEASYYNPLLDYTNTGTSAINLTLQVTSGNSSNSYHGQINFNMPISLPSMNQ